MSASNLVVLSHHRSSRVLPSADNRSSYIVLSNNDCGSGSWAEWAPSAVAEKKKNGESNSRSIRISPIFGWQSALWIVFKWMNLPHRWKHLHQVWKRLPRGCMKNHIATCGIIRIVSMFGNFGMRFGTFFRFASSKHARVTSSFIDINVSLSCRWRRLNKRINSLIAAWPKTSDTFYSDHDFGMDAKKSSFHGRFGNLTHWNWSFSSKLVFVFILFFSHCTICTLHSLEYLTAARSLNGSSWNADNNKKIWRKISTFWPKFCGARILFSFIAEYT